SVGPAGTWRRPARVRPGCLHATGRRKKRYRSCSVAIEKAGGHHSRTDRKGSVRRRSHWQQAAVRLPARGASRYTAALQSRSISMVEQSELNRLFWQSRRGMLELDVLLVLFVKEVYPELDEEDQRRYRKLLSCEDQDMFGWFMEHGEPEDEDLRRMVRMILDRVQPK